MKIKKSSSNSFNHFVSHSPNTQRSTNSGRECGMRKKLLEKITEDEAVKTSVLDELIDKESFFSFYAET